MKRLVPIALAALSCLAHAAPDTSTPRTMQDVLDASRPSDWRKPDPRDLVYMELPGGRVVIELASRHAPLHAENIRTLVRAGYFDGLEVLRVQDNYVTQWGDPDGSDPAKARPSGKAAKTLAPEFERAIVEGEPFTRLPDGDVYAPEVGFSDGFPVGRDPAAGRIWLAHCYGMVGAGRDNAPDSGPGQELYVVIGHAPRHLDRNIALVGRVLKGMEHLAGLPRGNEAMGFYGKGEARTPIRAVRLAADVPEAGREPIEVLRTDTPTFAALIESRRNRHEAWFLKPAGKIDLCNVPIPVRVARPAREP